MAYAHDGRQERPVATARAGDGSFLFLSRPALDFAITGGVGGYEALHAPEDLRRWVRAAFQLLVDVRGEDWEQALALRRAIWQLARASIEGARLPPAALGVVNRAARVLPITRQLDRSPPADHPDDPGQPGLRVPLPGNHGWHWRRPATLREVLSAVARDAIELLALDDPGRLRVCAGHNCALIFFDDSRSGGRRWCAPQRCGDRTRARDYRARNRPPT